MDFEKELNKAQREAVLHDQGPLLVIAGAGSGKTRTVVYRLARLVNEGLSPYNILLLTFTRKAAGEMLARAEMLVDQPLRQAMSGTFHSFAYSTLRRFGHLIGFEKGITIMDRPDAESIIKLVKDEMKLGKGEKSFPKKGTIADIVSKSRNKEKDVYDIIAEESIHLAKYSDDVSRIAGGYRDYKFQHGLADYDDLLFHLETLLMENPHLKDEFREKYRHVMVDEYQDTNLVQARLVQLLAGKDGNVMAVGDDAQSIYAFRGANVENILNFPNLFNDVKIVRLEQNYRSTQPILNLTNEILKGASRKYDKKLFTENTDGELPQMVKTISDTTQASLVVSKVLDLSHRHKLSDMAVLFRAGYHSYAVEVALNKMGVPFRKYGGIRFSEAAHIKDVLSFMRAALNPSDMPAWSRVLGHIKGIGPKTAIKIVNSMLAGDEKYLRKCTGKYSDLGPTINLVNHLRSGNTDPVSALEAVISFYNPILMETFPDDYPRRQTGLEQLTQIAAGYRTTEEFLGDMSLENLSEDDEHPDDALTLSTVHSSKGLEFAAVLIIDLVEDRFPSKKALVKPESLDEERRLLYVACTRAKEHLFLFSPESIYNRYSYASEATAASPFLMELPPSAFQMVKENYSGGLSVAKAIEKPRREIKSVSASPSPAHGAAHTGFCKHKVFGKGKIIKPLDNNKYQINFPGFGLKVIIGDYLEFME